MKFVNSRRLNDADGAPLTDYSLTSGSAVYTEPIKLDKNMGFASILAVEEKAGGNGDVDISAEYSVDGTNFYTPYTSDLAGNITADGNVVTALGNATRWIVHAIKLAKYIRYKLDPDADSQITLDSIYQEEN